MLRNEVRVLLVGLEEGESEEVQGGQGQEKGQMQTNTEQTALLLRSLEFKEREKFHKAY